VKKAELVATVAKQNDLPQTQTTAVINSTLVEISRAIKKEGRVSLPDFGTFTVKKRAARKGRNPQTGAEIRIKASKTVGFKPAPALKKGL
jgi:DNA-binding protein HU-beta